MGTGQHGDTTGMAFTVLRRRSPAALVVSLIALGCSSSTDDGSSAMQAAGGTSGGQAGGAGTASGSSGQAGLAAGAGGTSSNAGSAGAAGAVQAGGAGGAGGSAGAAAGGVSGSGGQTAGSGGQTNDLYAPAPRDIMIAPNRGNMTLSFRAEDADPEATSYHGGEQAASFNADAAVIRKKLVIGLHGIGNGPGPGGAISFAAQRGFHTLTLDYYNNESGGPQGAGYLEIWSGEDYSPDIDVPVVNSVRHRVESGLAYLQEQDPGADWAYYLNADGTVRWSDVIAFGYSFGGQTAAAATKLDALDKAIATSAPGLDSDAEWILNMPSLTPGDRGWALFDESDGADRKGPAATALGWPGSPVDVTQNSPPYDGSHILLMNGGGHSEFCSRPDFDEPCNFVFGVNE